MANRVLPIALFSFPPDRRLPSESRQALRMVVKVERACCDEDVQNDPQPIVAGFLVAKSEVADGHRIQGGATVQA